MTGKTDTPNFSLDPVGHAVPLHTDFSATVDGTDGDTYLHPVKATLGKSVIVCEGSVVHVPNQGHLIQLNVDAPNAHIEDILALAINSDKPFMTGSGEDQSEADDTAGQIESAAENDFGRQGQHRQCELVGPEGARQTGVAEPSRRRKTE